MTDINNLLAILGYDRSQHYFPLDKLAEPQDVDTANLLRAGQRVSAHGIYVFRSEPDFPDRGNSIGFAKRAAVFVAVAKNLDQAREIHRRVWNLSHAPFLIVLLPNQVRVYTGFDYSPRSEAGLLEEIDLAVGDLHKRLEDFFADSIDTGNVWRKQYQNLRPERRVDVRLLDSLQGLAQALHDKHAPAATAHALIGKYVYIRYLYDRGILSEQWLHENGIEISEVLGRQATRKGLARLVEALDQRFNGNIFPVDLDGPNAPTDDQIALTASVFKGDMLFGQMHMDFDAYQFQYIPVEVLSSIYEQFLHDEGRGRNIGAFYTPEVLADYVLSEINATRPLHRKMKILDPSCGSGVFLVLAYRYLVEQEIAKHPTKKLRPSDYRQILLDCIYGVERERDACYVTEFSLILTLLDYLDPPDLHKNKQFKFPALHNSRIFECDFFDDKSLFWKQGLKFDWIIGNPPWIKLEPDLLEEELARQWIDANQSEFPVGDNRVSEAFSWRVTDLVQPNGMIGLVLHAMSLVNHKSERYRRAFFQKNYVRHITNFSNLRHVLFNRRSTAPAMTVIYCPNVESEPKADIVHYGPFFVNQTPTSALEHRSKQLWTITINESEIKTVLQHEAEQGNALTWKLALWGTPRDRIALQRLTKLFPTTLGQLCSQRGWFLQQGGPEFRRQSPDSKFEAMPTLIDQDVLDAEVMTQAGRRFSIPNDAIRAIEKNKAFIRQRGGKIGLKVALAPHLAISASWSFIVFSDKRFLLPPRQIGLASDAKDANDIPPRKWTDS